MHIISSYHDYYDGIRAWGIDPKIVYVRKTEEEKDNGNKSTLVNNIGCRCTFEGNGISISSISVSFCNKIYIMFRAVWSEYRRNDKYHLYPEYREELIHTDEKLKLWLTKLGYIDLVKAWNTSPIKQTLDRLRNLDSSELHIALKIPVISVHYIINSHHAETKVEYNPNLRKLEFGKHVPPVEAFQRISMFIGGLAVDQKPMPIISDEMNVQRHGFDKYSFRKLPTKKRK